MYRCMCVYIYIYICISLSKYVYIYIYTHIHTYSGMVQTSEGSVGDPFGSTSIRHASASHTPSLPTNIIPTQIARLELSGKSPMDMGIPPLNIKIMLESNPLQSTMLGRLGVIVS